MTQRATRLTTPTSGDGPPDRSASTTRVRARLLRRRDRRAAERRPDPRDASSARSRRSRTSSTAARPAPTRAPATAPGSCSSCPTSSSARSSATSCRRPGSTASPSASCRATTRRAPPSSSSCSSDTVVGRGPARRLLARRADRPRRRSATRRAAVAPVVKQLVVAASPELAGDRDAFERKLYVIRRVAELAAGPDLVIPSFSSRTIVYKGMLMAPQLAGCYPDLRDPRIEERARARPLALLDEHLPELGARAPLPDDRPQRRDQHAARQRQLDARARVAARLRALRRRPRRRCCRSCVPAARTRRTSTTCSSCSCSRAARCRTR